MDTNGHGLKINAKTQRRGEMRSLVGSGQNSLLDERKTDYLLAGAGGDFKRANQLGCVAGRKV